MDWLQHHLLSLLLLLPLTGMIAALLIKPLKRVRLVALAASLLTFTVSLLLLFTFDWHNAGGGVQMVQSITLIAPLKIRYAVGLDGLGFPLIILTTFASALAVIGSRSISVSSRLYFALLLCLETGALGIFVSADFSLYWSLFTLVTLPIYFLIGLWGGTRREQAAIKFALFSLLGSAGLLIVLVTVFRFTHTFDLLSLPALFKPQLMVANRARALFLLTMLACLTRLPAFPFHSWLLDVHSEAATPIAMLLAVLLPAIGGYTILHVAYPLFPEAARGFWFLIALIGVVTLLWSALCAMAQTEIKRLVAYAAVSNSGLILLGVAMMTPAALNGAIFMLVAGGIASGMLVLTAGVIHDRLHHGALSRLGGLATVIPYGWGFSTLAFLANLGLPGLSGFVGQILILLGTFQAARGDAILARVALAPGRVYTIGLLACFATVLNAAYTLRTMSRVFFGPVRAEQSALPDLTPNEFAVFTPFAVMTLLLGIVPSLFVFAFTNPVAAALLKRLDS